MSANKVKFGLEKVHVAYKGVAQTEKIEVTDPPTSDGEITLEITADTLLGIDSPVSVVIPLDTETHGTVDKVASAIVNVINNDNTLNDVFYARHDGGVIYLIAKVAQSNDSSLSISFTDTDTTSATMGSSTSVTEGTTGWGEPKHIPGAVNLSTSPEGEQTEFYADNRKYFIDETNDGYTGDLEFANIPDEILAEILGMSIDNNGMLVESANDDSKEFALMAVALKKLEIIHSDIAVNKTKLYKALSQEFGNIGSRQNFSDKLDKYLNSSYSFDKNEIQEHIEKLQSILPLQ